MTQVLLVRPGPTGCRKQFTIDKATANLYVRASFYIVDSSFRGLIDTYLELQNESGATLQALNPQPHAVAPPNIVNYTFTQALTAGQVIYLSFYATDGNPANWPGVKDIYVSTDPIP